MLLPPPPPFFFHKILTNHIFKKLATYTFIALFIINCNNTDTTSPTDTTNSKPLSNNQQTTNKPYILMSGKHTQTIIQNSTCKELGASVVNPISQDTKILITSNINTAKLGTYIVTCTLSSDKNISSTRIVKVMQKDTPPPTITLNSNPTLNLKVGASAKDSNGRDISKDIILSGYVDTSIQGDYKISYSITDKNNNQSIAYKTITVSVVPQVITTKVQGNTVGYGDTSTFSISLNSKPTSNVFIEVQSSNTDEATISIGFNINEDDLQEDFSRSTSRTISKSNISRLSPMPHIPLHLNI